MVGSASANTLDFTSWNGYRGVNITATPEGSTGNTLSGAFEATDTTGTWGTFIAWCLDLEGVLASNSVYSATDDPFSNSNGVSTEARDRIDDFFKDIDVIAQSNANTSQSSAVQIALWEILYDDDYNLGTGVFQTTGGSTSNAQGLLDFAKDNDLARTMKVTYLEAENGARQNLVTISPVPLPAAGFLLLGGLGGLTLLRTRRKSG
ncbi:MAG: VPLPA-CTERM sorting domain-containing protein [Verrucomicrobia bacterium]|nr:VPLPA-CTERM sorting domain-containing protein [Verrucomicrobiota bacterium]